MSADGRGSSILLPRKSVQRSNSSSSISSDSSTSSTSTMTSTTSHPNGIVNGDKGYPGTGGMTRNKFKGPVRGIMPASSSKAEPVAGLSDTRSQSITAPAAQSAASSISALHNGMQSQHGGQNQAQPNGIVRTTHLPLEVQTTVLILQPMNGTFVRKTVCIPVAPEVLRVGRQTNLKSVPATSNGYFDSKVLSRQHAEVWAERDGRVWIRDVKSSNGTFVNGERLSQENQNSEPHPLKQGDILELGIDIVSEDQKTIVHRKVAARVEHAGPHALPPIDPGMELGDMSDSSVNGAYAQGGRGRVPNQAPTPPNGRFPTANGQPVNAQPASYHAKWLQPVSMEQIVKRLNAELKQARNQANTINTNHSIIQAMKPPPKAGPVNSLERGILRPNKSTDSFKARMASAPSAPPPSQPLPEAPTDAMIRNKLNELPSIPPMLRRSDTEKPRNASLSASSSPIKLDNSSQILSLVDALSSAQKEIASQSQKLKDMEKTLFAERESRRNAEERANRLESANTGIPSSQSSDSNTGAKATKSEESSLLDSDLQKRADLMRSELDEMKVLMAQYRQRAETAESEAQEDRQTLAEMVESLEKRETAEKQQQSSNSSSRDSAISMPVSTLHQHEKAFAAAFDRAKARLQSPPSSSDGAHDSMHMNGSTSKGALSIPDLHQLGTEVLIAALEERSRQEGHQPATNATALTRRPGQSHLTQSAPYASMLGVVILGMGLMAYLNGWQKVAGVER